VSLIAHFISFAKTFLVISMVSLANEAFGIVLECEYKYHTSYWGSKYTCMATNLVTTMTDRNVTQVLGQHLPGKTNDDVDKVFIEHQNCPYLPINLGSHFKSLEVIYIMKSKVQFLMNKDLEGLTKLRIFDVSYNPIERLNNDFFIGHQTIEIISFYECQLKVIEPGALNPLVRLKEGHFQFNDCIDYRGDFQHLLETLNALIEQNCQPKKHNSNNHITEPNQLDTTTRQPCEALQQELPASMSFTQRNATVIITFLCLLTALMGFALFRLARQSPINNWNEMQSSLVNEN